MKYADFIALLQGFGARVSAVTAGISNAAAGTVPQAVVDAANQLGDNITALEQAAQGAAVTGGSAAVAAAKPAAAAGQQHPAAL